MQILLLIKKEYANSVVGASPRWTFLGKIINPDDSTLNTTVIVLVIDSDQEAEIGIGRDWDKRPLGYEEVYVSNSALRQIHVQPNRGDRLHLGIDFVGLVQAAGVLYPLITLFQEFLFTLYLNRE